MDGKIIMKTEKKPTKRQMRRYKRRIKNRSVTKAKFLYWYLLFAGSFMFSYGIGAVIWDLVIWPILIPLALIVAYFIVKGVQKNWKVIWLYIRDMEQGRLLLFLNEQTHFSEEHKKKAIQWIYPRARRVRKETKLRLSDKVMNGGELTKEERKLSGYKAVYCPQQLLDGFNKALLVNALIYSHVNIHVLDQELLDIMELTDERMASFRLKDEAAKCKRK